MEASNVEIIPFRWKGKPEKAKVLKEEIIRRRLFRIRPHTVAEIAAEIGINISAQSVSVLMRKYWGWIRLTFRFGTIYIHPEHYLGSPENEYRKAKELGLFT